MATIHEPANTPPPKKKGANLGAKSKTSAVYWMGKVEQFSRKVNGITFTDADYSCRISFKGRRERFPLHTPSKEEAAKRASERYRDVVGKGWAEALRLHKPETQPKPKDEGDVTVGRLIEASLRLSSARPETLDAYAKALRRVAAGVFRIGNDAKYDALKGGREEWVRKVNAVSLSDLTPARVLAWKNEFLQASKNPKDRESAAVTFNSLIRNAKALLSKKVRPFLEQEMTLPSPLFYEGITAEKEGSLRYRSRVDAEAILQAAQADLAPLNSEAYKLLLLTLVFGLRRSEADTLLWEQFDFQKHILRIEDTDAKRLKSRDSARDVDLDPATVAVFQEFKSRAKGRFVLEPSKRQRISEVEDRQSRGYRCDETHGALITWLRKKGVKGARPLHIMRKEIGSIIASRDGIFAASLYLGHSDVRITSRLYADKKTRVTAGLGVPLLPPAANVVAVDFGAQSPVRREKLPHQRRERAKRSVAT